MVSSPRPAAPLPSAAPLPLSPLVDNIGEKSGNTLGVHWTHWSHLELGRWWRRTSSHEPLRGAEAAGDRGLGGRILEITPDGGAGLDAVEDGSVDTVASTFVLCRVADLHGTLTRIRRALAPEGVLLFLEHVGATGWRQSLQRAATPAWQRLAPGCHLDRDIPAAIRAAGMAITDIQRFPLPWGGPLMVKGVRGTARRRAQRNAN
ncbi:MAG TPA: methyltransferase domain-containing protein, partial [Acidimicrobiales bacterium]|nr:methyltransferase domain-containing protein [Acidimicrobiales bacterium]